LIIIILIIETHCKGKLQALNMRLSHENFFLEKLSQELKHESIRLGP